MHVIRLRRPWVKRSYDASGQQTENPKANVPDTEAIAESQMQKVVYARSFNRPTGLDDQSSVFLNVAGWSGTLDVIQFNQTAVDLPKPACAPMRIELTSLLKLSNEVQIVILASKDSVAATSQPLLNGEVQIEII
jgi:hypothetical protein